jgi:hypothetical protein
MRTTYNSYIENSEGMVLPLMISLPSNYNENRKYPLTIFLHGKGEFIWGNYPNPSRMYVQGITKEIKNGKRDNYDSIVVAIQGQSNNGNWWVEQIEFIIDILFGNKSPKANHRNDILNTFKPLEGIRKYNLHNEIDFMVISQGGQGFSDWLKRTNKVVGTVTLVCAYVTLNASDANFNKIKKGLEIYHSSNDSTVGKWGSEQLYEKAKEIGLNHKKVIYNGTSHAIWDKAFADSELYEFHAKGFDKTIVVPYPVEETPPVVIPPIIEVPPVTETPPTNLTPQFLDLNTEMFSSTKDIKEVVRAILEEREPPVKWNEPEPYTIKMDLGKVYDVTRLIVKDGEGMCLPPNQTIFKTDNGVIIGEFTGNKYNSWYQLSGAHKTRYIIIENVISTKKNLPIGLKVEVLQ